MSKLIFLLFTAILSVLSLFSCTSDCTPETVYLTTAYRLPTGADFGTHNEYTPADPFGTHFDGERLTYVFQHRSEEVYTIEYNKAGGGTHTTEQRTAYSYCFFDLETLSFSDMSALASVEPYTDGINSRDIAYFYSCPIDDNKVAASISIYDSVEAAREIQAAAAEAEALGLEQVTIASDYRYIAISDGGTPELVRTQPLGLELGRYTDMYNFGDCLIFAYGGELCGFDLDTQTVFGMSQSSQGFDESYTNVNVMPYNGGLYLTAKKQGYFYATEITVESDGIAVSEPVRLPYPDKLTGVVMSPNIYLSLPLGDYTGAEFSVVYYYDDLGLVRADNEGSERLFFWTDVDLVRDMVNNLYVRDDGRIIIEVYDSSSDEIYLVAAEYSQQQASDKLVVACSEGLQPSDIAALMASVRAYNLSGPELRAKLKLHSADDGYDELVRDAISDETLDIIVFDSRLDPSAFVKQKALRDLYGYIKRDDEYNRDAFLPCVLEPFETDGKLYTLAGNFSVTTLGGVREYIGNQLTLDRIRELAESDAYLMRVGDVDMPSLALLDQLLTVLPDAANELDTLLPLCKSAKLDTSGSGFDPELYQDGEVLLRTQYYTNPVFYLFYRYLSFGGSDSYIASGTDGGTQPVIGANLSFSITRSSEHPDEAWAFIKSHFTYTESKIASIDNPENLSAFPSTYEAFERLISSFDNWDLYVKLNYTTDANGKPSTSYTYVFLNIFDDIDEITQLIHEGYISTRFTQRDLELLRGIVTNSSALPSTYVDSKIKSIILEEAATYFAGAKTLNEVISIIENRVTTVINE
ncbi:MAG TPA: hypothetical protein H9681_05520 [Firmicutes bacterium]|nr:hypothetical protein [Bacillota bacterium]